MWCCCCLFLVLKKEPKKAQKLHWWKLRKHKATAESCDWYIGHGHWAWIQITCSTSKIFVSNDFPFLSCHQSIEAKVATRSTDTIFNSRSIGHFIGIPYEIHSLRSFHISYNRWRVVLHIRKLIEMHLIWIMAHRSAKHFISFTFGLRNWLRTMLVPNPMSCLIHVHLCIASSGIIWFWHQIIEIAIKWTDNPIYNRPPEKLHPCPFHDLFWMQNRRYEASKCFQIGHQK